MNTFTPANALEVALAQARSGELPIAQLIPILLESNVAVPSAGEVLATGAGFQPLLFDKGGVQMLGCFTDKARFGDFISMTPFCLEIKGRELLRRLPPNCGLVVNPGIDVGFELSPDGVRNILRDFA